MDQLKRLQGFVSRISADQYLAVLVLSLVILSCANLCFSAIFGPSYAAFLTGPGGSKDNFADLIKMSFSYRPFLSGITTSTFLSWPAAFQTFYLCPVYGGREALASGAYITHFHVPPLQTLLFLANARLIASLQSITLDLAVFFGLYLATVQCALVIGIPRERRTIKLSLAAWFLALLSYPALMVFCRGNFQSGIASLLIVAFVLSLFVRNAVGPAALAALAVAVNFRPNAIIFVLALPFVLGLKQSLRALLFFGVLASGIFTAAYLEVNSLYSDYTLSTFLRGLEIYKKLHVVGSGGDADNSSLWGLLKNYGTITAKLNFHSLLMMALFAVLLAALYWIVRRPSRWQVGATIALIALYAEFVTITGNRQYVSQAFSGLAIFLAASAGWALWRCANRRLVVPFLLTAFYCLFCPVFADYHLLVFLGPVLMVYFDFHEWAQNYRIMSAIAIGSVLMLAPKNYIFVRDLSLQTIFNPLILCVITSYVISAAAHVSPEEHMVSSVTVNAEGSITTAPESREIRT